MTTVKKRNTATDMPQPARQTKRVKGGAALILQDADCDLTLGSSSPALVHEAKEAVPSKSELFGINQGRAPV